MENVARLAVHTGIEGYQDDPNLQNLIDQVQLVCVCSHVCIQLDDSSNVMHFSILHSCLAAVDLTAPMTGTEMPTSTVAVLHCRGVECLSHAASRWVGQVGGADTLT